MPRRPQHQHPFGIEEVLDAKSAPDIGRAHGDPVGGQMKHRIGKLLSEAMHALAGQQQFEAIAGGVVMPDRGARLDRSDDQPVVDELDLDDMRCPGERRADRRLVAALEAVRQIARRLVP